MWGLLGKYSRRKGISFESTDQMSMLGLQVARAVLDGSPQACRNATGLLVELQQWATATRQASSLVRDGLKFYKPTTPSMRHRVTTSREGLWKGGPFKPLCEGMAKTGGRNNHGCITSWHRGGGHRKIYRMIDFHRKAETTPGEVVRIEYDPNRSARIALVRSTAQDVENDKDRYSYVLAPHSVVAGSLLQSGSSSEVKTGNALPLSSIPIGQTIHNVELYPGKGGQMARAAGVGATLVSKGADGYAVVKLPSGEQRRVLSRCIATIGALSNPQHKNVKLGKAGAARWTGRRPITRGIAMNSVDHPMGGGRGKQKGRISQSPWGKPAKGGRTRKPRNRTDDFIHLSRHKLSRR